MEKKYKTFKEFWPFYLSQHSNPVCRALHIYGTSGGIFFLIGCFAFSHLAWSPLSLVLGYGTSWVGHFVFEKNVPATFTYPSWSFQGDLKMLGLFLTGKLSNELEKHSL